MKNLSWESTGKRGIGGGVNAPWIPMNLTKGLYCRKWDIWTPGWTRSLSQTRSKSVRLRFWLYHLGSVIPTKVSSIFYQEGSKNHIIEIENLHHPLQSVETWSRWLFQMFFIFTRTWGNDPIWLMFFRWVVQPPTSDENIMEILWVLKVFEGGQEAAPKMCWKIHWKISSPCVLGSKLPIFPYN